MNNIRLEGDRKESVEFINGIYLGIPDNELPVEEIVFSIEGRYNKETEDKLREGLGIKSKRFTDKTLLELLFKSVDKALEDKRDLIKGRSLVIKVATESGIDLSQSLSNFLAYYIENKYGNRVLFASEEKSACVSGVKSLLELANSYKYSSIIGVVATVDKAFYSKGSTADATGGAGSVTLLLSSNGSEDDIKIYRLYGSKTETFFDFYKPVRSVNNHNKGIAEVNKYPIVYGTFSEYVYLFLAYKAFRDLLDKMHIDADNMDEFFKRFLIVPHLPYPNMSEKMLAYLVRHFARVDKDRKEEIRRRFNIPEEDLRGFESHEDLLRFMLNLGNVLIAVKDSIKYYSNDYKSVKAQILDLTKSIVIRYGNKAVYNQDFYEKEIRTRAEKASNSDELYEAVEKIYKDIVESFFEEDNKIIRSIRKSDGFKELKRMLHLEDIKYLSSIVGNIYTGSVFLGLSSLLAKAYENNYTEELSNKKILLIGYGSGAEAVVGLVEVPRKAAERFGSYLSKVIKDIENNKRVITAEEYNSYRDVSDSNPLKNLITAMYTLRRETDTREHSNLEKSIANNPNRNRG